MAAGGTGAELSTTTRPWTADAVTLSTLGIWPTYLAMRTSHARQVMPATGSVTEIVPAAVTVAWGTSMPAGTLPRPIRYSRRSTARRCRSSAAASTGGAAAGLGEVDGVWALARLGRRDMGTLAPVEITRRVWAMTQAWATHAR